MPPPASSSSSDDMFKPSITSEAEKERPLEAGVAHHRLHRHRTLHPAAAAAGAPLQRRIPRRLRPGAAEPYVGGGGLNRALRDGGAGGIPPRDGLAVESERRQSFQSSPLAFETRPKYVNCSDCSVDSTRMS